MKRSSWKNHSGQVVESAELSPERRVRPCLLLHAVSTRAETAPSDPRLAGRVLACVYARLSLSPPHLSVSPSLRLSVSPSLRLSVSPSLRLSVSPSLRLSVSPSLRLSVSPSLRLSVSPSLRLSVSPSLRLSVSPSLLSPSLPLSLSPSLPPSVPASHFLNLPPPSHSLPRLHSDHV